MKIKAYVHAEYDEYEKNYRFTVFAFSDAKSCGYTLVQEVEVEFDAPPREVMVNGTIAAYREQQQTIRAEAERKCIRLQQSIDDMLCLEYKPETAEVPSHDD